jgi:transcriptional regulator of NAD metabolism
MNATPISLLIEIIVSNNGLIKQLLIYIIRNNYYIKKENDFWYKSSLLGHSIDRNSVCGRKPYTNEKEKK